MSERVPPHHAARHTPSMFPTLPPVLIEAVAGPHSRAITAPFAGCRRFSPQCRCIRKNRDSSCRNDRHHRYVGKVATARERLRKDYESAPKKSSGASRSHSAVPKKAAAHFSRRGARISASTRSTDCAP